MKNSGINQQVYGIIHEQFHADTLISFWSVYLQTRAPLAFANSSLYTPCSHVNEQAGHSRQWLHYALMEVM